MRYLCGKHSQYYDDHCPQCVILVTTSGATTNTPQPDWKERFREEFRHLNNKLARRLEAFFDAELELEREDETERLRFYTKETRRVALSQVKEIIKGMMIDPNLDKIYKPNDYIEVRSHDEALQDLLKKLDEL